MAVNKGVSAKQWKQLGWLVVAFIIVGVFISYVPSPGKPQ